MTINLGAAVGPLLATLAGTWGSVLDQGLDRRAGDWDGDCATWQNYYAPGTENDRSRP